MAGASGAGTELSVAPAGSPARPLFAGWGRAGSPTRALFRGWGREILEGRTDNTTVASRLGCASWCFASPGGVFFAGGCSLAEAGAGEARVPGKLDASSAGPWAAAGLRSLSDSPTATAITTTAAAPIMSTLAPRLFSGAAAASSVPKSGWTSSLSLCQTWPDSISLANVLVRTGPTFGTTGRCRGRDAGAASLFTTVGGGTGDAVAAFAGGAGNGS